MVKSKIKIKEIKKKIKITEIKKEEESLEEIVNIEDDFPLISTASSINPNPTLTQHLDSIPLLDDGRKISLQTSSTREEKAASTAVNYATSQTSSRRSYDSSIRQSGNISPQSQFEAERINPTLGQSTPLMKESSQSDFDLMHRGFFDQANEEPALRRGMAENEKSYQTGQADAHMARRKTNMM